MLNKSGESPLVPISIHNGVQEGVKESDKGQPVKSQTVEKTYRIWTDSEIQEVLRQQTEETSRNLRSQLREGLEQPFEASVPVATPSHLPKLFRDSVPETPVPLPSLFRSSTDETLPAQLSSAVSSSSSIVAHTDAVSQAIFSPISQPAEESVSAPMIEKRCPIKPRPASTMSQQTVRFPRPPKIGEPFILVKARKDKITGAITQTRETYTYGAVLGKGTSGKVQEMIRDGVESIAFKFGHQKASPVRASDANRDYEASQRICSKGIPWGMKIPPFFKVTIPRIGPKADELTPMREGFFETKYEKSDLRDQLMALGASNKRLRIDTALHYIHQILSAGAFMDENGIIDGDRKEENILCIEIDGVKLVHMADFGATVFAEDIINHGNLDRSTKGIITHTPPTTANGEQNIEKEIIQDNNINEFLNFEKKRMTFSLGCILYSILTSARDPYPLEENFGYSLASERNYTPISKFRKDVSQELENLIKSMLHPDYSQRPDPTAVKDAFDLLLASQYPAAKAKIQTDMQKLGYTA